MMNLVIDNARHIVITMYIVKSHLYIYTRIVYINIMLLFNTMNRMMYLIVRFDSLSDFIILEFS